MATVLVITANTLLDHVATAPFAAGSVNRVPQFAAIPGGKGLNVGRVLARHGHRVIACGFAGGDSGRQLQELVTADGLEAVFTTTAARTRIGFAITTPEGSTSAALEHGFAVTAAECGALVRSIADRLGGCQLVIGSGSVPDPSCTSLWRLILAASAVAEVPCWIDSYGDAMREALTSGHAPLVAKPNRQEYAQQERAWLNCPELHLTDGGAGLRIRHPQGRWRVTPPRITERNAIGSGDAYLAGLAHARLSGFSLPDQWRYAAAAGAANAARSDVAQIGPQDITPLVDQVTVVAAADDEAAA